MTGFVVVNRDVLIARELERGGRYAPGLDFIRWRYEQLKREIWDDAEFWGLSHRDIALSRAEQLAELRAAHPADNAHNAHSEFRNGNAGLGD